MKIFFSSFLLLSLITGCSHLKGEKPASAFLNVAWIKNLDPVYDSGNLPIGLQSPLVHEGIAYAGKNSGAMEAYELENGRLVWSEKDNSTYHAGAVAFKDQVIYGTVQGRVISRHGILGTIKYAVDLGAAVESVGVLSNGRLFFHLRNHQIFALDAETGKVLWAYKRSVPFLTTLQRASTPVVHKGKVIVGFADGTLCALSVEEGSLLYEVKLSNASKFVDVDNSPFIYNDQLFISPVGGVLHILNSSTGSILKTADFGSSRAPILIGEKLAFGTFDGRVVVTDKMLNVLESHQITKGAVTSIVPFKGQLALGTTSGEIKIVNKENFKILETFHLGHSYSAVYGEMISSENSLLVMSSRNRLYLFR